DAVTTINASYRASMNDTAVISRVPLPTIPVVGDDALRPDMDSADGRNPWWWLSRRERRELAIVLVVTSVFVAAFALLGLAALGAL
ncbi:MAG: hypothetical protein QOK11_2526, partial [Pseudonocardiales bacterium]|nr:hypothetical protein [Pseudonocardiales bacterium]